MSHLIRVLTQKRLKKKLNCYKQVKKLDLNASKDIDSACWKDDSKEKIKREYYRTFKKHTKKINNPDTIESVVWKSFLGFLGGIFFTFILFFFFYVGAGFSAQVTTFICGIIGVFLSLGLAFSHTVRCWFFLALPIIFLKQGREGLVTFVIFLAITGPCSNTMKNIQILTGSMNCRQTIIRTTLKQIIESVKTPLRSLREVTQKLTKAVKEASITVKSCVINMERLLLSVLNVLMESTTWLHSIVRLCNQKVGTPFQRCMTAFESSIADCKAKLGVMEFLCHIVHMVKPLCYSVKDMNLICAVTEFLSERTIKVVQKNQFDNLYISKYIVEMDMKRVLMNKETVLPLEPREEKKFAKPTSLRLLHKEKIRMTKSIFLLCLTSIKIVSFVVVDYSLFWVLITIYEAGFNELQQVERPEIQMNVHGVGAVADFYRNLSKAFILLENPEERLNNLRCLPDPEKPNVRRNMAIGFFLFMCWICTVTEAYGLRLRNVVMSEYYPDRARERAVWLYNYILYSRASFVKLARKSLKRKFQHGSSNTFGKPSMAQEFLSFFSKLPILGPFLLRLGYNICLMCGDPETEWKPLKRCKAPKCPGKYCLDCFVSLRNFCMICHNTIDLEVDLDLSEEVDSSEEEFYRRERCDCIDQLGQEDELKTFKDMLGCDKLRDKEPDETKDYDKLDDEDSYKENVRKQLKEAIIKRLQTLSSKKGFPLDKKPYRLLSDKLRELIRKYGGKSVEDLKHRKELLDKIDGINPEKLKKKSDTEDENLPEEEKKKSTVSNTASAFIQTETHFLLPQSKSDYEKLKDEVRGRIKLLTEENKASDQENVSDKSSEKSEKKSRTSLASVTKNQKAELSRLSQEVKEAKIVEDESCTKFWKECSEIEASKWLVKYRAKKDTRSAFEEPEPEESSLEYWKKRTDVKPSIECPRSRNVSRLTEKISEESLSTDNLTYYIVRKKKNVYMRRGPRENRVLDVNIRTFVGPRKQKEKEKEEEKGNFIL